MMRRSATLAVMAVAALATSGLSSPASGAPSAQRGDYAGAALRALQVHPGVAREADGLAFTVRGTLVDPDGTSHVRLDRTYQGLRVLGGDLVVHQGPNLGFEGVSQTLRKPLTLSVKPTVGAAAAERTALGPNRFDRGITGARKHDPKSELVIDTVGGAPRLAWQIVTGGTQADGTPSRLATLVDARTGALIRAEQQIETVGGDGQSIYSGTVPLELTLANGTYSMQDPTRGNTSTKDVKNGEDLFLICQLLGIFCADGPVYAGPDAHFGDGTNTNRESAGVDAQYGTNVTWDYFKNVHGRNGIFNNGTGSQNRVHYGSGYVNAFWDGKRMTYGDGDGVSYGPLVSLDVAGHEMSHGVTTNSANLTYSGESGGLNESTSDIFGSLVEAYAANSNDPGDYYIGEQFDLAQHDGFRRMDTPSKDGKSADCWTSGVGDLNVHYSSGVGNHFFYLLAEGTGSKTIGNLPHTSTTCNGTTITGIGSAKAGKIWYRALTVYMTSSTDYAGARVATLKAASDLFGASSTEYNTVAAAWSGVSVG